MNENQIDKYCKIMNVSPTDIAEHIKKILSPPLSGWIRKYFIRTRNYDLGLSFVGICRMLIAMCPTSFSHSEYADIDVTLTYMHLDMLDLSNQWYEYVREFDDCRKNKLYALAYAKDSKRLIVTEKEGDDDFFAYVIGESEITYKVHFLYICSYQYAVIKRKIERYESGRPIGGLLKHQQDVLTDDELERRLWTLRKELMEYMSKMEKE